MIDGAAMPMGISPSHRIAFAVLGLVTVAIILELVRRDRLKERYALLWMGIAAGALVVGVFPEIIVKLSLLLRFQMITAMFVFSFLLTMAIILAFSVVISRLCEQNRKLTQEVALLAHTVKKLESSQ